MNPFETALTQLKTAVSHLELEDWIVEYLSFPERTIQVSFPVKMDSGEVKIFKGYRVQYNNFLGPYKGGLRFHPQVDINEVKALSFWMMIKNAVCDVPFGGGKGGVEVDPKVLSANELERLTRAFGKELSPNIGPEVDVPAPDVNTNGQIMIWIAEEYRKIIRNQESGIRNEYNENQLKAVITGKPVEQGGSEGREEATGLGGFFVLKQLLAKMGKDTSLTVAVQGFGNVGSFIADLLVRDGFKIVALSDSKGGIYNENGLDIEEVKKCKKDKKVISECNGKKVTNEELLELPVDILVPAALENVITINNANNIKAQIILEMANGPTTSEADKILNEKGIKVVPDVLANSGGVTVSYFEWYQNMHEEKWSLEAVEKKLEEKMKVAFESVWQIHEEKSVNLRTAAYILALQRISAKAIV